MTFYLTKSECLLWRLFYKKNFQIICKKFYTPRNILKLSERGFWKDRYPESNLQFEKDLISNPQTVYSGFDPTADSLHIGNLLVLIGLLHFQRAGHNCIVVIGGATGAIGDPSGKNVERSLLHLETVKKNSEAISSLILKIIQNHEYYIWNNSREEDQLLKPFRIVNNINWYNNLNVLDYLRNIGKHMAMGSLLRRSTIKKRLEADDVLSYTEFSYQVLQAYDWLHLYQKYNCTIQIGGSDQFGNMASGHKLISRVEDVQVTGLTVPLVTSKEGDKLGKTAGNAIWLSPEKTSAFDFYQYFVRLEDNEVEHLLKLLTFLPLSEIETLMKLHKSKPEERRPQKKLAEKLTLLVHGDEGLKKAKKCTDILYGGNSGSLADLSKEEVINLFKGSSLTSLLGEPGMTVLEMAMKAKCFHSDRKGIQVIEAGGFHINQAKVTNPHLALLPGVHILPSKLTIIRVGKKNYHIVEWQ